MNAMQPANVQSFSRMESPGFGFSKFFFARRIFRLTGFFVRAQSAHAISVPPT